VHILLLRSEAKRLVGIRALAAGTGSDDNQQVFDQAKTLFAGSIDQRLRFVVLAGELAGPQEALDYLDKLDALVAKQGTPYNAQQQSEHDTLRELYGDYRRLRYDAPSVTDSQRAKLREELGWFGQLALAPAGGQPGFADAIVAEAGGPPALGIRDGCPDPQARKVLVQGATTMTIFLLLLVGIGLLAGFLGFVLLVSFVILLLLRKLRSGVKTGASPAGVYAETFALWMLFFAGLQMAAPHLDLGSFRLIASGLVELASLVVVFWPVLRGVPWKQVREDIGWTWGRKPLLEPAAGIGCYLMSLPVLCLALLVMVATTWLQKQLHGGGPGPEDLSSPMTPDHPIVVPLARGDWSLRLQVLFLACIVAPIVEEAMFRGVLYRHLREATRWVDPIASVMVSAAISSFIFAVIHPQGLLGVPMLMALALGFVIAREWRGTVLPGMVAHGLNNGFVLLMSIVLLGD
jgi:membrane protease YdiL (CAAX protease family)